MPARRSAFFALLSTSVLALSACDFADADGVSGRWAGAATFSADTIYADANLRVVAEYETVFTFRLTDDEGLLTGTVEAQTTGYRVVHEAGYAPDTLRFEDEAPIVHEVFGTFLDPTLELDVPDGPYEEDLWTFEVAGRRARLDRFLVHTHGAALHADGSLFSFTLLSDDVFEMRREADEE